MEPGRLSRLFLGSKATARGPVRTNGGYVEKVGERWTLSYGAWVLAAWGVVPTGDRQVQALGLAKREIV